MKRPVLELVELGWRFKAVTRNDDGLASGIEFADVRPWSDGTRGAAGRGNHQKGHFAPVFGVEGDRLPVARPEQRLDASIETIDQARVLSRRAVVQHQAPLVGFAPGMSLVAGRNPPSVR